MGNPFVCGSSAFHHQPEEDEEAFGSPCSTPRKSRRSSKNPYAERGLDKFSALLAELQDKRQKIYTQMGSGDISFVRFVYPNSDEDCKPLVVRAREKKKEKKKEKNNVGSSSSNEDNKRRTHNSEALHKHPTTESSSSTSPKSGDQKTKTTEPSSSTSPKSGDQKTKMAIWRPCYYLAVVIVLILLFLAVFGRSFAVICASIGWYLFPTINGGSSNVRPSKKKEYARRASEKNIRVSDPLHSPRTRPKITRSTTDMWPRQHAHRKDW